MKALLFSLLLSLVITLATELSLALLLKVRSGKDLLVIALVNLLTNPIVNYCAYWMLYLFGLRSIYTILVIILLEAAAVLTEFLIYRQLLLYERIGKLKLSLLLNGASFLAGLAVSGIIALF